MGREILYDEPETGLRRNAPGSIAYDEVPFGERRDEAGSIMRPPRTTTMPVYDPATGMPLPGTSQEVTLPREPQKYEPYPTMAEMHIPSHLTAAKLMLASSPEQRIKLIRERMPDARITEDKYGNPLVVHEGKTYHIDRPDFLNLQDVTTGAAQALIPTAAAIGAGMLAPAAAVGVPMAVGAQMLGGGLSEAANRIIAGEQVTPGDILPAAAFSAIPEAIPALRGTQKALAGVGPAERMPVGARHYFAEQERRGRPLPPGGGGTMPIDVDPYRDMGATKIVGEGRAGSSTITQRIADREADRPARVRAEIDNTLGPPPPGVETMRRNIDAVRRQEGHDPMTAALQNAPPVNTSTVRGAIAAEMTKYLPNDPSRAVFQDVLNALGTASSTDAQALQNYLRTLQQHVDFGPPNAPFTSNSDPRKHAYEFAYNRLRDALGNVPGYNEAAGAYSNLYRQVNHFEAGRSLLGAAGASDRLGGGRLTTERALEIFRDAAQPNASPELVSLADALRAGLRQEMETKITRGAEDLSGLRRVAGRSEMDPRRELLDAAFGTGSVDRLVQLSERERGFMNTAQLIAQRDAERAAREARTASERHLGPGPESGRAGTSFGVTDIVFPKQSLLARAGDILKFGPLLRSSRGQTALGYVPRGYTQGVSDVLTSTGAPLADTAAAFRQMVERDAAINRATQLARFPVMSTREEQTGPSAEQRRSRPGRASGGRLDKIDHAAVAAGLIRAAEKAKKGHSSTTEPLLNEPDEAITKALAIANEALE